MKKTAFFGILVGVMATGSAFAETAFEGQAISSIPLTVGKSAMVAVAFKELSADVNQNVSVSNILSTANLVDGDMVYVYRNGGYQSWTMTDGYWKKNDGTFTLNDKGQQQSGTGADSTTTQAVGEGFWLVRKMESGAPATVTVYIYGATVDLEPTTATHGVTTLMGNPTNADATPTITDAAAGDRIGLYAGDGKLLKTYSYNNGYWWLPGDDGLYVNAEVAIPKGAGFWYNSVGSKDVSFSWEK